MYRMQRVGRGQLHSECIVRRTGHTRVDATQQSAGPVGLKCTSSTRAPAYFIGRTRVRIEKQRAPDGLGALLTNILRVVADYQVPRRRCVSQSSVP
jgi:hypothetical protein